MTTPFRYPTVRVSGTPHERGIQYGAQARVQIRASRIGYERVFAHVTGWTWEQAVAAVGHLEEPVQAAYPEYIDEMRGIAEGSGLEFRDVFTMNARTEVIWAAAARNADHQSWARECSSFALMPARTNNQHTLVGQNWDWLIHSHDSLLMLEVEQPDAPNFVTLVEGGLLAKASMNSAGIGVAVNALVCSLDRVDPGIPFHVLIRALADSPSLNAAIATVAKDQRSSSGNYLIAHADGIAVNLETAPGGAAGVHTQTPIDGSIVHANHFLTPPIAAADLAPHAMPDSLIRQQRIETLIAERREPATLTMLHGALSDHADFPSSVCCHPDPNEPEADRWATVVSVVMDLTERAMYVADGNPCEREFRRFDHSDLLGRSVP